MERQKIIYRFEELIAMVFAISAGFFIANGCKDWDASAVKTKQVSF